MALSEDRLLELVEAVEKGRRRMLALLVLPGNQRAGSGAHYKWRSLGQSAAVSAAHAQRQCCGCGNGKTHLLIFCCRHLPMPFAIALLLSMVVSSCPKTAEAENAEIHRPVGQKELSIKSTSQTQIFHS